MSATSAAAPSFIDLRSDTVTVPDAGMRRAMAEAPVGDDVMREDPSVNELETKFAALTGKEKALFVSSGTQGNLICAILYGASKFPAEIIMGDKAHTNLWEVGGASLVGRVAVRTVPTNDDGTISLAALEANTFLSETECHTGVTAAIFLENTHNGCGGKVLPMDYVASVRAFCDEKKVPLHCDGARSWNAAAALGLELRDVLGPFDTASVCLSKGLGAPVGSVIVGPAAFIEKARKVRKMLGGGMRQCGIVAAGALYALEHLQKRIPEDHAMAKALYDGLVGGEAPLEAIAPQSNIVVFNVPARRDEFVAECRARGVRFVAWVGPNAVRAVFHYGNTMDEVSTVVATVKAVVASLAQ